MRLLLVTELTPLRDSMPFLEAATTTCCGRVLCDKNGMALEWRLLSIVGRHRWCEPALDEIPRMLDNRRHPFEPQIIALLRSERKIPAERRALERIEDFAQISHTDREITERK